MRKGARESAGFKCTGAAWSFHVMAVALLKLGLCGEAGDLSASAPVIDASIALHERLTLDAPRPVMK